jgi:5'-3' exonuclease
MRYKNIFVDVSNLFHRAHHVGSSMTASYEGEEIITGNVVISLKMIQTIERDYLEENGCMFFLFDNCHSGINKRKLIDPDYKSNRTAKEDSFYKMLNFFHIILLNYKDTYRVVKKEGYEADDLVDPLSKLFEGESCLLISNDLDWFRSISENVHVAKYEQHGYKIYKKEEFEERYGFEPTVENLCIYKSFRGDKGDNVPIGVPGIREKTLRELIDKNKSFKDICVNISSFDYVSDHFKELIKENIPRLILNYKLVSYLDISEEEIKKDIYYSKFNPRILNYLYNLIEIDIRKTDPRVFAYFLKENKKDNKSFFKIEKIPRA